MTNKEIAAKVVNRIIDMMNNEGKPLPWVKPWDSKCNTVRVVDGKKIIEIQPTAWNRQGKFYRGANTYLPVGEYITFNQCKAEGGSVKKGAKGWPVLYWNFTKRETVDENGETKTETIPFLKYYTVFRIEDCEGIEQKHNPDPTHVEIEIWHDEPVAGNGDLNADAEAVIADYLAKAGKGLTVVRDRLSDNAYYRPSSDTVQVPMREQHNSANEFYSTLFHELAHSTGHKDRLNRFASTMFFGNENYSREELVAEATAASVLNALGLEEANTFRNSAGYIQGWASHIKNDPMIDVCHGYDKSASGL